jgi:hypothetical protein
MEIRITLSLSEAAKLLQSKQCIDNQVSNAGLGMPEFCCNFSLS